MSWQPIPWLKWDSWNHGVGGYPITKENSFAAGESTSWTAQPVANATWQYRYGGWANYALEPTVTSKTVGELYLASAGNAAGQYSQMRGIMGLPDLAGYEVQCWLGTIVRGNPGTWGEGYSVYITGVIENPEVGNTGWLQIRKGDLNGAVLASMELGTITWANWTYYNVKAWAEGNTIKGKAWAQTDTEPSGWQIETTDSTYPTGTPGIVLGSYRIAGPASLVASYAAIEHTVNYEDAP